MSLPTSTCRLVQVVILKGFLKVLRCAGYYRFCMARIWQADLANTTQYRQVELDMSHYETGIVACNFGGCEVFQVSWRNGQK